MKLLFVITISFFTLPTLAKSTCVGPTESAFNLGSKGIRVHEILVNYDDTVTFTEVLIMNRGKAVPATERDSAGICKKLYNSSDAKLVDVFAGPIRNLNTGEMETRVDITCDGEIPEAVCPNL